MLRALIALILLGASSPALAYHEVASFSRSANRGGGAGSFYTGSPRYKSYDCTICHDDGEGRISIELSSRPAELMAQGTYAAEGTYVVTVKLVGEHRGLESAFNPNTFTAEFLDRAGRTTGILAPSMDTVMRFADDNQIAIAEGFGNGESEWTFVWNAPSVATAGTFYIAMLDGDGASDADRRFIDPYSDDVAVRAVELCPAGVDCVAPAEESEPVSPAGCELGDSSRGVWLLLLALLLVAIWRRPALRRTADQ